MELNVDTKFEGKMTCAFKYAMRNLAHFHQSIFVSLKIGTLMGSFYPNQKMSLNFTGEFCVMIMKNDVKFEEELTCQFRIDMRNLTNFDVNTLRSKQLNFNGLLLTKVHAVLAKKKYR